VLRWLARRLLRMAVLLVAVSMVTFALFFLTPGDPAVRSVPRGASPEVIAQVRHRMGLDQPLWRQYLDFLHGPDRIGIGRPSGILNWPPNLGYSFKNQEPVLDTILDRLPVTASLVAGAVAMWLLLGIPIGVQAALLPRSLRDRLAMLFALVGVSMPAFLLGLGLIYLFYFRLRLLPAPGYVPLTRDPLGWFSHLLLPWFSLAFTYAAVYSRVVRSNMLEVTGEDYVRTARAKGLPERQVVTRHVLRASLTPVVTMLGLDVGLLLGGAVITEVVFGLNGVGQLAIRALTNVDLPVIVGTVLFAACFVMLCNLLVDLVYVVLDPRIRTGSTAS
jgi:peptide/nickel transport system permease protein